MHDEYEINFVAHCPGARRIVGDSVETTGEFELILIGPNLEHTWEQADCTSEEMREITVQFRKDGLPEAILSKAPFQKIREMLARSERGVAFNMCAIMESYSQLDGLTREGKPFDKTIDLLRLLNTLAETGDYRVLSTSSFAKTPPSTESRRVHKVEKYINEHFAEEIRLEAMAMMAGMTPTAFSRFFRLRTGMSLSDFIIDVRMGNASRMLLETTMSVLEVCYACGFNNISNFNRLFRRKKKCSPTQFREYYKKNKMKV